MKGYPKELNSKEDYLYVRENFPREMWLPDFQHLLDTMRDWFSVGELPTGAEGIVDDTHKVEESKRFNPDTGEEETTWTQYELQINPMCKLLRLGFTEEEVRNLMRE